MNVHRLHPPHSETERDAFNAAEATPDELNQIGWLVQPLSHNQFAPRWFLGNEGGREVGMCFGLASVTLGSCVWRRIWKEFTGPEFGGEEKNRSKV